VKTTTWYKSLQ